MDTKRAIKEAFLRVYLKKDFHRITVKELCACTPVARTTFYAYYQNTDELLAEIEDEISQGLLHVADEVGRGDIPAMDFEAFVHKVFGYIQNHREYFLALLVAQPDIRFEKKLKAAIKFNLGRRYPEKKQVANYELIAEILASAALGGYRFWLQNPEKVQEDELIHVLKQAMDQLMHII